MSTTFSPLPAPRGLNPTPGTAAAPRRLDAGARRLATLLLAAAMAALVVLADQLIDTWVDGHLFLGWVTLWVVIFASAVLFAGTAGRMAHRTLDALDGWSRSLAEARAEARLQALARRDPRLKTERTRARQAAPAAEVPVPGVTAAAAHDFSEALAPMGLDTGTAWPALWRRQARQALQRPYVPYL